MTDSTDNARGPERLQDRVAPWMDACFGPEISADKLERGDRFLEEALELLQSGGYPQERVVPLRDYVFNREPGEPSQEVGGVMITLAAYCLAHGLDMHDAGETELARIWTKVDKIRAKQAAKPVGSALPVRSALEPCDPLADPRVWGLVEAVEDGIKAGLLPRTSASEGGAAKYSAQVRAADRLRAALAALSPTGGNDE